MVMNLYENKYVHMGSEKGVYMHMDYFRLSKI